MIMMMMMLITMMMEMITMMITMRTTRRRSNTGRLLTLGAMMTMITMTMITKR